MKKKVNSENVMLNNFFKRVRNIIIINKILKPVSFPFDFSG